MSQTTVVNIYKNELYDVYIGRAGKGQDGTFGNPYFQHSREDNLKLFEEYFYKRIKEDPIFCRKVHSLKGKRLGCFCSPKRCHGDIIANYLNKLPEEKSIKLAVVGSRSFSDYEYMKEILSWYDIKRIVSGGAKGADLLARRYAIEHNIPYKEFLPEWNKYGKSAGYLRNEKIVQASDEIVAFWDGVSKGTKHTIDLAEKASKPVYVYKVSSLLGDNIENW